MNVPGLRHETNINSSFPFSLSVLFDQDCFCAEFGIKLHSGWDKYCLSCLPSVQSAQSGWPLATYPGLAGGRGQQPRDRGQCSSSIQSAPAGGGVTDLETVRHILCIPRHNMGPAPVLTHLLLPPYTWFQFNVTMLEVMKISGSVILVKRYIQQFQNEEV